MFLLYFLTIKRNNIKLKINVLEKSLKYTQLTQSVLCLIFFNVHNNHATFTLRWTKSKQQIAVYDSDTPVTLRQGQGHQTLYALEDPKQNYNYTKFENPHLNNVHEKANDKVFVKSGNTSIISLEQA